MHAHVDWDADRFDSHRPAAYVAPHLTPPRRRFGAGGGAAARAPAAPPVVLNPPTSERRPLGARLAAPPRHTLSEGSKPRTSAPLAHCSEWNNRDVLPRAACAPCTDAPAFTRRRAALVPVSFFRRGRE